MCANFPGNRGFTLFDLLTALVVLAILLMVGVPSFNSVIRTNRIATATNSVVTSLTFARSEAMKRGDSVSVCASAVGVDCDDSTDWGVGWMAFVDINGDGSRDPGEPLLQVWPGPSTRLNLTGSSPFLQYTSTGLTNPVISNGSFEVIQPGYAGDQARCVRIGSTGRIMTERNTCT